MEWLGRGTYTHQGGLRITIFNRHDYETTKFSAISGGRWEAQALLMSCQAQLIRSYCLCVLSSGGWGVGNKVNSFFSIDRMSMNIVDVHHYTGIYVSLHKDFHVHVYLQTPYRFEARPPRQPRDWHCGWSTQWGHVGTGPSGPSVSQQLGALDGFFAIIYLACHKLGFLLDFPDILQLKRSLKCVLLVTLSGHRNVTMKPHLAMWPG